MRETLRIAGVIFAGIIAANVVTAVIVGTAFGHPLGVFALLLAIALGRGPVNLAG